MNHSRLIRKEPEGRLPDTPTVYDERLKHHKTHTEALEAEVCECEVCGSEAPVAICGESGCAVYFCGRCGDFRLGICDSCLERQAVRPC